MTSNSKGSYHVTSANQMNAYDKLPPSARLALQGAAFDWAVPPIRTSFNRGVKGYRTGPEIAVSIQAWDEKKIAKDRSKVWGIKDETPQLRSRKP